MLSAKSNLITSLIRIVGSLCLFVVMSSVVALSQTETPNPQRGFYPGGSYSVSDIEAINTVTGNLTFKIPLATLPPGRGGLSASLNLTYNAKLWDTTPVSYYDNDSTLQYYTAVVESQEGGWHYDYQYVFKELWRPEYLSYSCGTPESQNIHKVQIRFPDGSLHDFAPQGYGGSHGYYRIRSDGFLWNCTYGNYTLSTSGTMTYYSTDGTFLRLDVQHSGYGVPNPWTLYFPNGTKVTGNNGPERITDRNGNYVEFQNITYNTHPAIKIVDQFDRAIILEHDTTLDRIHQTGFNGASLESQVYWGSIDCTSRYYQTGATGNPSYYPYIENLPWTSGVSQIVLPYQAGSLTYDFGTSHGYWDEWYGEITSMSLPSQAGVVYKYGVPGAWTGASYVSVLDNKVVEKDLTYLQEYDGSSSSVTDIWQYNWYTGGHTDITGPDGGVTSQYYHDPYGNGDLQSVVVYKTVRPDGSTVEQIWQQNKPYNISTGVDGGVNSYVKTEFTSIKNAAGTLDKTAIKDYTYDKNGNVTEVDEYDWVPYGDVPRTSGNPTGLPSGATPSRVTVNTYFSPTPAASDSSTSDADAYHKSTSPSLKNALESSEVRSGFSSSLALSRSELVYDSTTTTGNVTQQISWDSTKGSISRPLTSSNWVRVLHTYDSYGYGDVVSTTDARGNATNFTYDTNNLYVTQVDVAASTGVQQTTTMIHNFDTGLVTLSTAVDNSDSTKNVDTASGFDDLGRPISVVVKDNSSSHNTLACAATVYSDSDRRVIVRKDLSAVGDGKLVSIQHYDQLGRVRLTQQLESTAMPAISGSICTTPSFDLITDSVTSETVGLKTQTRYFAGNSTYNNGYQVTSNPYRGDYATSTTNGTTGWTRTKIDQSGRQIESKSFEGKDLPAPWGTNSTTTGAVTTVYDSNLTGVTDQAGKERISKTDGLGRLINIWEIRSSDGSTVSVSFNSGTLYGYQTGYIYNALGDLTEVDQGSQTRTFSYTSLGRLASAANPESGTVSYTYDNNGNLSTKTDAIGNVASMSYDQINRVTAKSYSVTSPTVATSSISYLYDYQSFPSGAPSGFDRGFAQGRLVAVNYGGASAGNYYGYDGLGEVLRRNQQTDTDYLVEATYNKAGGMLTETYPTVPNGSGRRVVTNTFDSAGRLDSVTSGATTYALGASATSISYAPHGGLASETYGTTTPLIHTISYTSRLQPLDIMLGVSGTPGSAIDLTYEYGGGSNNGNITAVTNSPVSGKQYFTYDELNRLIDATETGPGSSPVYWDQSFSYDRFGNRTSTSASSVLALNPPVPTINAANNRFVTTGGAFGYDAAGNLSWEPTSSGSSVSRYYTYDAENHLIEARQGTSSGSATATGDYVYDGEGKRVKKTPQDNIRMIYGISGSIIAEFDSNPGTHPVTKEYIYGPSGLLATIEPGSSTDTTKVKYTTSDHLGSPRVIAYGNGSVFSRHDYLPFGEEIPAGVNGRSSSSDGIRQKFTTKERDTETGLDYFLARYYSSPTGRFTSPDEFKSGPHEFALINSPSADEKQAIPYGDITEPQSINKYLYCYDNPLRYIDPDGHDALWVKDKDTGQTTIVIPVQFTGKGATPEAIAAIVDRAGLFDTGDTGVRIQIVPTDKPINGVLNKLDLSPGFDHKNFGSAGEGVQRLGGKKGHINSDEPDVAGAASHETMHFAGIKDQYVEGARDANGKRTSTPAPGYDRSNIMTDRGGRKLKPEQIQEVDKNHSTKHISRKDFKILRILLK